MPSRDYEKHVVSTQAPVTTKLGDEYYNPTTNVLYKFLANNGTAPGWQQVLLYGQAAGASVTGGGTTFTGGLVANATTITNYFTVFSSTSVTTRGVQEISGNADGAFLAPNNSGVMLHITGQSGQPGRLYIDGQGTSNYAAVIGRKSRGTTAVPTQVFANDIVFRMGSTPYTDAAFPAISTTRLDFLADELQTVTAQGSRIEAWITQIGTTSSAIAKQLSIATTGTVIYNTATITQQLGIGLVPTYPLHVNIAATGVTVARFAGGSNVVDIYAGSGGTSYIGDGGARNAFGFNSSGNWLDIWTNNTEKVRFDTNGNILVGGSFTSPSGSSGMVIAGTATSVSTATGALQVAGGVGVGGDTYVGGFLNLNTTNGFLYGNGYTITPQSGGSARMYGNGAGLILIGGGSGETTRNSITLSNGGGMTLFGGASGTGGNISLNAPAGNILVLNTSSSVSTTTGALQVAGGIGVAGNVYAGGTVYMGGVALSTSSFYNGGAVTNPVVVNNSTSATSTTTGALQVQGGAGIGGDLYIGGNITTTGAPGGISGAQYVYVSGTATSISTTTGALQVAGGVGIGGTLYVGNLRADATTSATTYGVYYNATTKELTTSTAATGGSGGTALGAVITSAMGWNLP